MEYPLEGYSLDAAATGSGAGEHGCAPLPDLRVRVVTSQFRLKTYQLLQGYPREFDAAAAEDLVRRAWRMGFDVVRDPDAPARYEQAMREENEAMRNAPPCPTCGYGH